ncbi:MAG: DUF2688 domain-containing protein [Burkholderia gladioli]
MDRVEVIETTCRRCGCRLRTLSHSLYSTDEMKARLDRICATCTTPEEHREIERVQLEAMRRITS